MIPKFEKLIATIRSREISASIILQAQSQLKAIYKENEAQAKINIYVQQPSHTPLLQAVDYILWTIFRFYEKGETRYMDFMKDKIKIVNDIFAKDLEDKKNETCGG